MYTKTLFFILAFLPCSLFAQSYFKKKDFLAAKEEARQANKLLFVQVPATDCNSCNAVVEIALKDKNLYQFIQENCIPVKVDATSPEWNLIMETHNLRINYGSLIFSPEGNLLKLYEGSSSVPASYKNLILSAKKNAKDDAYEKLLSDYKTDTTNHELLFRIIQRRSATGLSSDSLLDKLVTLVPGDSLRSLRFIQFVVKQYPYVSSIANITIHKEDDFFKQAWYRMSHGERIYIYNRINTRSMSKAIRAKDLPYARIVATNHMRTTTNAKAGQQMYMDDVLMYYKGVKDTSNYITIGKSYLDQYIMPVSADSIRRRDSALTAVALDNIRKRDTLVYPTDSIHIQSALKLSASGIQYSIKLNDVAWYIYCSKEDDYYLGKALAYAKRAIELNDFSPAILDTYARLLYKTGSKKDAIIWEDKAIDLAAKQPEFPTTYKKVVKKMRADEEVTAKD